MSAHLLRPVVGITYSARDFEGFDLWRHVFHAFVAAGATPVSIDCTQEQPEIQALVRRLDGLVISGGGDVDPSLYGGSPADGLLRGMNPARDASERLALQAALDQGMPVLAICRGLQLVNALQGGTLFTDLSRDREGSFPHTFGETALDRVSHEVEVLPGTLLATWMGASGRFGVNSEHHQGLAELAPCLRPVAWAPDGLVEGAESAEHNLVGVQWHPEILWPYEASSFDLLRGFVSACAARPCSG